MGVNEGVETDAPVDFGLFEGLDGDGVAAWADRLRLRFSLLTSPMSFALAALD